MAKTKPKPVIPTGRLWPNTPSGAPLDIEVFGATGEYMSGKTLLGLSIAPGVHPEGHAFAGKPRTLLLDFEKSAGTYGGTGSHRIDVPAKMLELFGQKPYSQIDVFNWFVDLISKIKPGQFDVIVADPITDIESGQVTHIRKNPAAFDLTPAQISRGGGLLWGAVKDDWKQRLLKIGAKCQCFFFTSHLRQVWQGNTPLVGKREPKGKETLMELASLYLWLERTANDKGVVPDKPAAVVLKQRLSDTLLDADGNLDIIPLMPPRLAPATVATIREYIASPPDYGRLKVGERVLEKEFSEEEAARLALATAEAQRETESSRLEALARQQEIREMAREEAREKPQSPDQTAERQKAKAAADEAKAKQEDAEAAASLAAAQTEGDRLMQDNDAITSAGAKATAEQVEKVKTLYTALEMSASTLKKMLAKAGATKVPQLSVANCEHLIVTLQREADQRGN